MLGEPVWPDFLSLPPVIYDAHPWPGSKPGQKQGAWDWHPSNEGPPHRLPVFCPDFEPGPPANLKNVFIDCTATNLTNYKKFNSQPHDIFHFYVLCTHLFYAQNSLKRTEIACDLSHCLQTKNRSNRNIDDITYYPLISSPNLISLKSSAHTYTLTYTQRELSKWMYLMRATQNSEEIQPNASPSDNNSYLGYENYDFNETGHDRATLQPAPMVMDEFSSDPMMSTNNEMHIRRLSMWMALVGMKMWMGSRMILQLTLRDFSRILLLMGRWLLTTVRCVRMLFANGIGKHLYIRYV